MSWHKHCIEDFKRSILECGVERESCCLQNFKGCTNWPGQSNNDPRSFSNFRKSFSVTKVTSVFMAIKHGNIIMIYVQTISVRMCKGLFTWCSFWVTRPSLLKMCCVNVTLATRLLKGQCFCEHPVNSLHTLYYVQWCLHDTTHGLVWWSIGGIA